MPGAGMGAEMDGTTQPAFPKEVAPPQRSRSTTVTSALARASS